MPKFMITATRTATVYYEIEADDEQSARDLVVDLNDNRKDIDEIGGELIEEGDYWEVNDFVYQGPLVEG